jgi:hypothetical protein
MPMSLADGQVLIDLVRMVKARTVAGVNEGNGS